jgi:hypothetical protein
MTSYQMLKRPECAEDYPESVSWSDGMESDDVVSSSLGFGRLPWFAGKVGSDLYMVAVLPLVCAVYLASTFSLPYPSLQYHV